MEIVQKKASFINCFKKIILLFPLKSINFACEKGKLF